jgi:molybdopterin-guanine dinucleotide biosynthesis adapter protein
MNILGIAGWSGSGKTTLLVKLIPALRARGLSVSTLKHAHHGFGIDTPGKDSFEHRAAGATEVLISSGRRFALMHELRAEAEWSLAQLLRKLSPVDLVLVEGFKRERHAKLEVWRAAVGKPALHPGDPSFRGLISDAKPEHSALPFAALDDIAAVADLVVASAKPLAETLAALEAPPLA